jgi:hypothetical protein
MGSRQAQEKRRERLLEVPWGRMRLSTFAQNDPPDCPPEARRPALPGLEREQDKRRWHRAWQRIDDQEELVERLGQRKRRQRGDGLGTPLRGQDSADEPGNEVIAVVR